MLRMDIHTKKGSNQDESKVYDPPQFKITDGHKVSF